MFYIVFISSWNPINRVSYIEINVVSPSSRELVKTFHIRIAFQSLAEFKMLGMTLKVSFGWMIGSSKSMLDGVLLKRINFAVGILSIIEVQ